MFIAWKRWVSPILRGKAASEEIINAGRTSLKQLIANDTTHCRMGGAIAQPINDKPQEE
jgi:hypothetical protein